MENGSTRKKAIPGTSLIMTANEAPSGKMFDKWVITGYTNESVYSSTYTFIMPSGDVNAVATYKDIPSYTVSFHANGGTGTMSVVKGITGKYTLPSNGFSAPSGKQFKCWSINGVEKNPGDKINLSANITIKAVWKDIPAPTPKPTATPQPTVTPTPMPDLSGLFATSSDGYFVKDGADVRCYNFDGSPVINEFRCDGTYTYYFQADGTAMRDRLTYHPDGEHVIYFDEYGHEVFSNFANVKKTIAGEDVNDYCFFDVFGYLYVDVVTYDKSGTYLYYANPYGVMDCGKWFEFSDNVKWADGTPFDKAGGKYGYANADGTLMTNQWTYDWEGKMCYMQGNGVALYP